MDGPSFYFQPELAEISQNQPRPVQIAIHDKESDAFKLVNETVLSSILESDDVADRKVIIISVAGAYRTGKSFLLNFFLRYLEFSGNKEDWLNDEITDLAGFSWRGGSERETVGIWLWSKPFITTTDEGEQVAVLLMDTQGAFDSESTVKECAAIFALSTLIASVQIYNLSGRIQEDHFQNLQLFTEYGKFAQDQDKTGPVSAPFQTLIFFIRDWSCPKEYPYGFQGGEKLLKRKLQTSPGQHEELKQVRQQIRQTFSDLRCFLMPHPGLEIAETQQCHWGQLPKVETKFKEQLSDFVSEILSEEKLAPKMINGEEKTGRELMEYIRRYSEVLGNDLPAVTSVFQANADVSHSLARSKAKKQYLENMRTSLSEDKPSLTEVALLDLHRAEAAIAVKTFHDCKKIGTSHDYTQISLNKLESEIEEAYINEFKVNNEIKRRSESFFYRVGRVTVKTFKNIGNLISGNWKNVATTVGIAAVGIVLAPVAAVGVVAMVLMTGASR